jgi:carbamoyltransferase
VDAARTPWLDAMLRAYRARTGLPAVLNTSLNLHEEPIVARASEAAATFRAARLDALVLDDALVTR